jgi:6-phosphogluconolactonase
MPEQERRSTVDTTQETMNNATVLYVSVGPKMFWHRLDLRSGALEQRGSLLLPSHVQYAACDLNRGRMYVASSDGAPSKVHYLSVLQIGVDGSLSSFGDVVPLPHRPIFIALDEGKRNVLVAYNNPSGLNAYRISNDGSISAMVEQENTLEAGRYAHCVRVDGKHAILCARGDPPSGERPDFPGAVVVFAYDDGALRQKASIAPDGGIGFRVRHIDFHPSLPFAYLSLEANSELVVFHRTADGLSNELSWRMSSLADLKSAKITGQRTSAIRVDPLGRAVYVLNRADATRDCLDSKVFAGGENNVAVFRIDPRSGEPVPHQYADTHGFHPRELAIDPSGKLLVAINVKPRYVSRSADSPLKFVPGNIVVFRISSDASLEFIDLHSVDYKAGYEDTTHGRDELFWLGIPGLSVD